jgi:hypothetical protein
VLPEGHSERLQRDMETSGTHKNKPTKRAYHMCTRRVVYQEPVAISSSNHLRPG